MELIRYLVATWSEEVGEKTFDRETAKTLFFKEGRFVVREPKSSYNHRWYETREEAEAALEARIAAREARYRRDAIKDMALDLYDAVVDLYGLVNVGALDIEREAQIALLIEKGK